MQYADLNNTKLAYRMYGSGNKTIVIDTALGTCSAEWWDIAQKLSKLCRVFVFDRPGYGKSEASERERTPKNIAAELDMVLSHLRITDNIILLGHSQGGLYAMQYAVMYPTKVIGMVLLDPATPYDNEFKKHLTKEQYKKSGVDKTLGLKLGLLFATLNLGFILKPMLKKMPPFYYFNFSKDAESYLLYSLCKKSSYRTALAEYDYTHTETSVSMLKEAIEKKALGSLPIRLITHSSDVYHKELQAFGNMDLQTAIVIEGIWQEIMRKLLGLSNNARNISAQKSGHYIHLTDYDIVAEAIQSLM